MLLPASNILVWGEGMMPITKQSFDIGYCISFIECCSQQTRYSNTTKEQKSRTLLRLFGVLNASMYQCISMTRPITKNTRLLGTAAKKPAEVELPLLPVVVLPELLVLPVLPGLPALPVLLDPAAVLDAEEPVSKWTWVPFGY
jgi:hypothetical protein